MKTYVIAAVLALSVPAIAQTTAGKDANTNAGAAYDNQTHSTRAVRSSGDKNLKSQDGNTAQGGVTATGPSTTEAQAMGAAPGGSTGGTKSTGP